MWRHQQPPSGFISHKNQTSNVVLRMRFLVKRWHKTTGISSATSGSVSKTGAGQTPGELSALAGSISGFCKLLISCSSRSGTFEPCGPDDCHLSQVQTPETHRTCTQAAWTRTGKGEAGESRGAGGGVAVNRPDQWPPPRITGRFHSDRRAASSLW